MLIHAWTHVSHADTVLLKYRRRKLPRLEAKPNDSSPVCAPSRLRPMTFMHYFSLRPATPHPLLISYATAVWRVSLKLTCMTSGVNAVRWTITVKLSAADCS